MKQFPLSGSGIPHDLPARESKQGRKVDDPTGDEFMATVMVWIVAGMLALVAVAFVWRLVESLI